MGDLSGYGIRGYTTPDSDYEGRERSVIRTWTTSVEPTIEPLTLADLKNRLRVTECDDDAELGQILTHARKQVEADSYRRLITQTLVGYMDTFFDVREIELRIAPVSSLTSITYVDLAGATQTFASTRYAADIISTPPRVVLNTNETWELTEWNTPNAVAITLVAGYGTTAASVPAVAKLAIAEYAKGVWNGCEGATDTYRRLVSVLQWTAYHRVMT